MAITVGSGGTDTIIGSTARAPGTGVDTLTGGAAAVQIEGLGKGDVVNFAGQTGAATINATAGNIAVTLGGGPATVFLAALATWLIWARSASTSTGRRAG